MILEDQGRSARIVTAEDAIFLRSSVNAAPLPGLRQHRRSQAMQIRTAIHGLIFHNSRFERGIDSRFERDSE